MSHIPDSYEKYRWFCLCEWPQKMQCAFTAPTYNPLVWYWSPSYLFFIAFIEKKTPQIWQFLAFLYCTISFLFITSGMTLFNILDISSLFLIMMLKNGLCNHHHDLILFLYLIHYKYQQHYKHNRKELAFIYPVNGCLMT